jgi:hypothetical protein
MKKRSPQRTEADDRLLEEAGQYFEAEEIVGIEENAVRTRKREILAPQLKALFEREVDDRRGENGDRS